MIRITVAVGKENYAGEPLILTQVETGRVVRAVEAQPEGAVRVAFHPEAPDKAGATVWVECHKASYRRANGVKGVLV